MQNNNNSHTFFSSLESSRGVAAILVAAFHVGQTLFFSGSGVRDLLIAPATETTLVRQALSLIYSLLAAGGPLSPPVLFFFVLSGFVLSRSLSETKPSAFNAVKFSVQRVFRIVPAAAATVFLFWGLYAAFGIGLIHTYSLEIVLRNAVLLDVSLNGVMWSLQTELIGSALILVAMMVALRLGRASMILMTAVFVGLSMCHFWYLYDPFGSSWSRTAYLHCFLFGSLAWLYGKDICERIKKPNVVLALAAAAFFLALPVIVGEREPVVIHSPHISVAIAVQAFAAAIMIAVIAFGKPSVNRVLQSPLLLFYGRISFSLYLLHPISLMLLWSNPDVVSTSQLFVGRIIDTGMPRAFAALLLTIVSVVALTPLAYLMWRYVEIPCASFGKRIFSKNVGQTPSIRFPRLLMPSAYALIVATGVLLSYEVRSNQQATPCTDNFSIATQLNGSSGAIQGYNRQATPQLGEPGHAGAPSPYHSVWCKWTAPESGAYTFDISQSSFPAVVHIYASTSFANMPTAGMGKNGVAGIVAEKGQIYTIAIDGTDGTTGKYKLTWRRSG